MKIEDLKLTAKEYIEIYKAGFIDGWTKGGNKKTDWKKLSETCFECWKKRFKFEKKEEKTKWKKSKK